MTMTEFTISAMTQMNTTNNDIYFFMTQNVDDIYHFWILMVFNLETFSKKKKKLYFDI